VETHRYVAVVSDLKDVYVVHSGLDKIKEEMKVREMRIVNTQFVRLLMWSVA